MKIILAAGGSGGHIFPSVALATELEKEGISEIFFISSARRLDKNILKKIKHKCFYLSVNPMPRKFRPVKILRFLFNFTWDMLRSMCLVLSIRPDIVVGFGGYSSGAIVSTAKILNVPVLIHEQNYEPGRANKILSRFVGNIATSFEETEKFFSRDNGKVFCCGNPLRPEMLGGTMEKAVEELGITAGVPTILIMGGSQGSSFLNRTATEAALGIAKKLKSDIQYIHLTGNADLDSVKIFYKNNGIRAAVHSFLDRIDLAYAAADVVVSRSGAAAVFELAYYGKAMILIPYPNPRNNQRTNAEYFERKGAALYREEKGLSADILTEDLLGLIRCDRKRRELGSSAKRLSRPDAAQALACRIIKIVSGKEKKKA